MPIREMIQRAPESPGCYIWMREGSTDVNGRQEWNEVLYIGKSRNIRARLKQYLNSDDVKTRFLMKQVGRVDWIVTANEAEALLLESNLIKKYNPPYNIRLKDDKRYPYICLSTGEEYPRIFITRKKSNPKHTYYGPYTNVRAARNVIEWIGKVLPIRKRPIRLPSKKPLNPCVNYHIGRCLAPCAHKVNASEYGEIVRQANDILTGNYETVRSSMEAQMNRFAESMEYEKAAAIRDRLRDFEVVLENRENTVHSDIEKENLDILGVFGDTENHLFAEGEIPADPGRFQSEVVLLRIRGGNLVSKAAFSISVNKLDAAGKYHRKQLYSEILESCMRDYYLNTLDFPGKIVMSSRMFTAAAWVGVLRKKTERPVEILDTGSAISSAIQSLVDMATENARLSLRERLMREYLRGARLGLKQIRDFLGLPEPPEVIECYDISNIQGTNAVASGVYLKDGMPYKPGYRKYRIRTKNTPDDPAMIYEVIQRRLKRVSSGSEKPANLMVIDGGITQLRAALRARDELGLRIPIVSLAKKREEIYTEEGEILSLDPNGPGMRILRLARDEAHRFAVSYHRLLRRKGNLQKKR